MTTIREGWICPRCQAALSPDVQRCDCTAAPPATSADRTSEMLQMLKEMTRELVELRRPVYVPYPYLPPLAPWQSPQIQYCSNTGNSVRWIEPDVTSGGLELPP